MKLLYRTAEWHGFAKLRMHSHSTLEHLENLTTEFGALMRQFRDRTCSQFHAVELPREVAARNRQTQRDQARASRAEHLPGKSGKPISKLSSLTPASHRNAPQPAFVVSSASSSRKPKTLNLLTPKFHALGDYVRTIQLFGCTDSFSTQLVRYSRFRYPKKCLQLDHI